MRTHRAIVRFAALLAHLAVAVVASTGDCAASVGDRADDIRRSPAAPSPEALLIEGGDAAAAGDLGRALRVFAAAARLAPDDPVVHYNLGLVHYRLGDDASAIAAFTHASTLAPDGWLILMNRGSALSRSGDIGRALGDFDRAAGLAPDQPDVFFNRAIARGKAGDLVGALADYERVLELDCSDVAARRRHADILRRLQAAGATRHHPDGTIASRPCIPRAKTSPED